MTGYTGGMPFATLFMRLCLTLCLLPALAACGSQPIRPHATSPRPAVLLVSVDGLRPRDVTPERMPNASRLAAAGVRADGMRPSYPSLTFPNHYTLVTGLRPDRHGIVHNSMRDAQLGEFRLSNREAVGDGRWWGGEPVWIGAQKAGLRTATLFWPGSEAAIGGVRPTQWVAYDEAMTAQARVDQVLDWLAQPEDMRPAFVTLYFDQVDHQSHHHGPDSKQARSAIQATDQAIGRLVDALAARGQLDRVNLLLVSDHGFAPVPDGQVLAVEDLATPEQAVVHSIGQVIGFTPNSGHEAEVERRLLGRHPHYQCWKKADLPPQWQYGAHARVAAITCQMDEGWDSLPKAFIDRREPGMRGSHGYDPTLPSMQATFIGHGPAFRPGTRLPVFDNVDVYPLLMHLLDAPSAPNQGTLHTFEPVLQPVR